MKLDPVPWSKGLVAVGPLSERVSYLSVDPNYADPNLLPLSLRIFRARFLRESFRFEWPRQESDFAIDVLEQ